MRITTLSTVCEILTAVLSEYYVILSGFDIKLDLFFSPPFHYDNKSCDVYVFGLWCQMGPVNPLPLSPPS